MPGRLGPEQEIAAGQGQRAGQRDRELGGRGIGQWTRPKKLIQLRVRNRGRS